MAAKIKEYAMKHSLLFLFVITSLSLCHAYKLGYESLTPGHVAALVPQCKTPRLGLVTNHTGVTDQGQRVVDYLLQKGFIITKLFAPEHGISGTILAEKDVTDTKDAKTGLPVISLYKNQTGSPADSMFEDIDVILFDMQDSGMRHYTYISTLYQVMRIAAALHKPIIVLDRPNPLGPNMEGPLVES